MALSAVGHPELMYSRLHTHPLERRDLARGQRDVMILPGRNPGCRIPWTPSTIGRVPKVCITVAERWLFDPVTLAKKLSIAVVLAVSRAFLAPEAPRRAQSTSNFRSPTECWH